MNIRLFALLAFTLCWPFTLLAAPPYENAPDSKSGPGVEEIWTDNGVRYYRGLPGAPNTSRPRITGVQRYQPEVEFGAPAPLVSPGVKNVSQPPVRKAVKAAPARKAAPKKTASRRRAKRAKAVAAPAVAKVVKPAPVATRPLDDVPLDPGTDPFSGMGILGTTRLQ